MKEGSRAEWRKKYRKGLKKKWDKDPRTKGAFKMTHEDLFKEMQVENEHFLEGETIKETDRNELLERYDRIQKGLDPDDAQLESIRTYQQDGPIKTVLVPAKWNLVIAIALLNSFAVFWTKVAVFEVIGKPEIFTPSHYTSDYQE